MVLIISSEYQPHCSFLPLLDHKFNCDKRKKEQHRYCCFRREHSRVVNNVELLSGHGRHLGVNTVCKVSKKFQHSPPEQESNYPYHSTPDQNLCDDFKHFVNCVHVVHSSHSNSCYLKHYFRGWVVGSRLF